MYSVVFLTQFWPTYGMVHFTPEGLISSWYTYEIKIHVRIKYFVGWMQEGRKCNLTIFQEERFSVLHWVCIGNNLNLILNDWKVIDSYLKLLTFRWKVYKNE